MPHRKSTEKRERPISRPSESIAKEFDEPGAGRPLDEAALTLDERGEPIEQEPRGEEGLEEGPGVAVGPAHKREGRKGRENAATANLKNTGSGVAQQGPDAATIPGGGKPLVDDSY